MNKRLTPKARTKNLVTQETENEIIIYDLDINKVFLLNETSAAIWQACDGHNDISNISNKLNNQFGSSVSNDFVWLALDQLKRENLIENSDEIAADFNGLSRREVLRKVGFGTALILPVVSSLIAPLPAHAASPTVCGIACTCTITNLSGCQICTTVNPCATGCTCLSQAGSIPVVGQAPPGKCQTAAQCLGI